MSYHPIQRQILTRFISQPRLRYSQIKLPEIENDLFNYHLQYLVRLGVLQKNIDDYELTTDGLKVVLMFDSQGNVYKGLRVSVLVYVIDFMHKPSPRILSQKHIRQPYLGDIQAGISGKVIPGELIENAASRKLKEETGLVGKCKLLGVIRKIRQSSDKTFLDDGLFHVCICTNFTNELIEKNDFGENAWISFEQAINYEKNTATTGKKSKAILENILKKDYLPFYIEEEICYPK